MRYVAGEEKEEVAGTGVDGKEAKPASEIRRWAGGWMFGQAVAAMGWWEPGRENGGGSGEESQLKVRGQEWTAKAARYWS